MTTNTLKSLSILAVDDDPFMLNLLVIALKSAGIESIVAVTKCVKALEVIDRQTSKIDVLLFDLNTPGMDGIEFLRHVAKRDFSGAIVLISAQKNRILKSAENLARAHNLRILGSLEKPVTRNEMADMLDRISSVAPRSVRTAVELITEEELRHGILGGELSLVFQPKVEIATRKVVGVESLVRWNHPTKGTIGPAAFVPVAERCGMIDALTLAVFVMAMKQGSSWRAQGFDLKVAVNLSVDNLNRLELPEDIVNWIDIYGMDPHHVMLEVTESRLMSDLTKSLEILTRLCLKGVSLSIDDFGTGFSSMEQLQRIPFEEMKIDRAFVNGATRDSSARAILESSIKLAHELNMTIVAEGVERREDWDLVSQLGCHLAQGYFVAKPMPAEHLHEWITEWYLGKTGTEDQL